MGNTYNHNLEFTPGAMYPPGTPPPPMGGNPMMGGSNPLMNAMDDLLQKHGVTGRGNERANTHMADTLGLIHQKMLDARMFIHNPEIYGKIVDEAFKVGESRGLDRHAMLKLMRDKYGFSPQMSKGQTAPGPDSTMDRLTFVPPQFPQTSPEHAQPRQGPMQ